MYLGNGSPTPIQGSSTLAPSCARITIDFLEASAEVDAKEEVEAARTGWIRTGMLPVWASLWTVSLKRKVFYIECMTFFTPLKVLEMSFLYSNRLSPDSMRCHGGRGRHSYLVLTEQNTHIGMCEWSLC